MYNIHMLPASFGDSILVEYGKADHPRYILIDGGPYFAFEEVIEAIKKIAPRLSSIELLVITHIDIDHIDGIVKLLNRQDLPFAIKDVWFNGFEEINKVLQETHDDTLGALQGEYLTHLIKNGGYPHNRTYFKGGPIVVNDYSRLPIITLQDGMELQLLGPGKAALKKLVPVWEEEVEAKIGDIATIENRLAEDTRYESDDDLLGEETIEEMQDANVKGDKSEANGSSIAFIGRYDNKACLFAADCPSDYVIAAIEPILEKNNIERLPLDAWKLAHHGSKKSTLDRLMEKIDCKRILVSSDGKRYKHPDQVCIAKLFKFSEQYLELYFNYKTPFNEMWDDRLLKQKYKYKTFYPNGEGTGIALEL